MWLQFTSKLKKHSALLKRKWGKQNTQQPSAKNTLNTAMIIKPVPLLILSKAL